MNTIGFHHQHGCLFYCGVYTKEECLMFEYAVIVLHSIMNAKNS